MDTKEDAVKKTKRKRPTGNGGKVETEQIGSILGRQAKRLGVKL